MNTAKFAVAAAAAALLINASSVCLASRQTAEAVGPAAVTPVTLEAGQIDSIPQPIQNDGSLNMIPEPMTVVGFAMAISTLGYCLRRRKDLWRQP